MKQSTNFGKVCSLVFPDGVELNSVNLECHTLHLLRKAPVLSAIISTNTSAFATLARLHSTDPFHATPHHCWPRSSERRKQPTKPHTNPTATRSRFNALQRITHLQVEALQTKRRWTWHSFSKVGASREAITEPMISRPSRMASNMCENLIRGPHNRLSGKKELWATKAENTKIPGYSRNRVFRR